MRAIRSGDAVEAGRPFVYQCPNCHIWITTRFMLPVTFPDRMLCSACNEWISFQGRVFLEFISFDEALDLEGCYTLDELLQESTRSGRGEATGGVTPGESE